MSRFKHFIGIGGALLSICLLAGCVTAPYRYRVDVGGDYYYDARPVASPVHVLPTYGAFGYGVPGGWHGSVGFGFGPYYGLGGYYGPSWGTFNPRHGYTGYWRPPYYYTPRYSRPQYYYRTVPRQVRPLPWWHESANVWRRPRPAHRNPDSRWNRPSPGHAPGNRPGRDNRGVDGSRPGTLDPSRPGQINSPSSLPRRRTPFARPDRPRMREIPRDMAIQSGPTAPPRRVQHASMLHKQPRAMEQPPSRRNTAPPGQAVQPGPMPQRAQPAPMPSRPAATPRPMRSPPPASRGGALRRGGRPQHER